MADAAVWNWVDGVLLGALLLSGLLGAWRGLVVEVLSALGWLVAWVGAQWWGAAWPGRLGLASSWWSHALGYALCFVALLFAWRLVTWAVGQLMHASPLASVDRVLGAGFGLLRGLLIVLVLVSVIGMTPLAGTGRWQSAPSVRWAQVLLAGTGLTPAAAWQGVRHGVGKAVAP